MGLKVSDCWILFLLLLLAVMPIGCGGGGGGEHSEPVLGYIKGTIKDAKSGGPIEGVKVNIGGISTFSLSDGSYFLQHPPGTFSITVDAPQYFAVNCSKVIIGEGIATIKNFELVLIASNNMPAPPILHSPLDNEEDISLKPKLKTNSFFDPDIGDIHSQSRWEISINPSFFSEYIILDLFSEFILTELVPQMILIAKTKYYWRVKFYDNFFIASNWSDIYSFTTISDNDGDGIPDIWERQYGFDPNVDDSFKDSDQDGIMNLYEYYIETDPTKTNPSSGGSIWGIIKGKIIDAYSGEPISAQIITSGKVLSISLKDGTYVMSHPAGTYKLVVTMEKYYPATYNEFYVPEGCIAVKNIKLVPIHEGTTSGPIRGDGGVCFIASAITTMR